MALQRQFGGLLVIVTLLAKFGDAVGDGCFLHQVECDVYCKDYWLHHCIEKTHADDKTTEFEICCIRDEALFGGVIAAIVIGCLIVVSFIPCCICFFCPGCPVHDWRKEPKVPHVHHHAHPGAPAPVKTVKVTAA